MRTDLLYPFQVKAANFLLANKRAVLGSDLGVGKTRTAIAAALQVPFRTEEAKAKYDFKTYWQQYIIVVCPASVRGVWEKEFRLFDEDLKICVVNGGIDFGAQVFIFSYEKFTRLHKSLKIPTKDTVFVFDEAHYLKNLRAKRTTACIGKDSPAQNALYVWLLTGTPMPNNIVDAYMPFNFCLRGKLGRYWEFASKYAYVLTNRFGKKISGCRREMLPELAQRLAPVLYRDKIEDVLPELPDYQEVMVPLDAKGTHVSDYEKMFGNATEKEKILAAIAEGKEPPLSEHCATARRQIGLAKIELAAEFILDKLEETRPLVVFTHHVDVAKKLWTAIAQKGVTAGCIVGDTEVAMRDAIIRGFQEGENDVLIVSVRAGGVGITLTRSHVAIFVEVDWTPAVVQQAMGRIRRIGQKEFCLYYFLYFKDTFDEEVLKVVRKKGKDIEAFWGAHEEQKITTELLESYYEKMKKSPDVVPIETINGKDYYVLRNKND